MTIINLREILVNILVKIAPDVYSEYVTENKKNHKNLLIQYLNALYGTMVASLLYYKKFADLLKSIGFEFNPYNLYIINKIIKKK